MAELDDWQDLTSPGTAAPASAQAPAVTVAPQGNDDWQEVSRIPTDPGTGAKYPVAFSGISPETARNDKSVVDVMDRLKMSVGNTRGNISYLKTKFGADNVRQVTDKKGNPTKNLAVLKDGSWYNVDPENGQIADPWEKTKEYVKDLADVAPMIGGAAVAAGATYLTGGVAAVGAGAAAEQGIGIGALRTSLGRLVGTYEATPMEQAHDIALEGLLNAAGVKIAPGVKPTASWMADKIKYLAEAFRDTLQPIVTAAENSPWLAITPGTAGNWGKDALKQVLAGHSVGVQNFDTMLENPEMVKTLMKNAIAKAGGNVDAYHENITMSQMLQMKEFADSARTMLSRLYAKGRNYILASVDDGFAANFDKPIMESYRSALSKGLAKIDLGDGEALYGKEALEAIANNNNLRGVDFKILSQDEMKQAIRGGAEISNDLGYLATNADAHATVSQFYKEMSDFAGSADRQGVEAAKDLMNFKKVMTDKAYDLANQEHVQNMPGVKSLLDNARLGIDQATYEGLPAKAGEKFLQLNKIYSSVSDDLVPVLNAKERYATSKDLKVYQGLLSSFLAKPGKQVSTKFAIDSAIDAADMYGMDEMAAELAGRKTAVQVGEAAKAFNPIPTGFTKGANALGAGFGIGTATSMMTHGVNAGNTAVAAGLIGQAILRSPKTAGAAAAVVRGLSQGQEFLSLMNPVARGKLMSDPAALQSFVSGITAAPIIYQQTAQQLGGAIQQAAQPRQGSQ